MNTVWVPATFYDDHEWRDLDTPKALIDIRDPAMVEYISDAEHYAHPLGPDCPEVANICRSARLTTKRLKEATAIAFEVY